MKRRVRIFVSGSTNARISEEYYKSAIAFGKMLDVEKHDIIFDGCNGLPGVVASQISEPNDNLEIAYTTNHIGSSNEICNNWPYARRNGTFRYQSEVTRALLEWSDIAVFFKGGSGTLAELFHAIDTKKNMEHQKPIFILNVQHQWDDLLKILEPLNLSQLYYVIDNIEDIIHYIENLYQKYRDEDNYLDSKRL